MSHPMRQQGNSIYDTVCVVLKNNTKARNNDDILYADVIEQFACNAHLNLSKVSVIDFYRLKRGGMPSYDSVSRIRRQVQNDHSELCANACTSRHRFKEEMLNH